jgi:hypothetical protein
MITKLIKGTLPLIREPSNAKGEQQSAYDKWFNSGNTSSPVIYEPFMYGANALVGNQLKGDIVESDHDKYVPLYPFYTNF